MPVIPVGVPDSRLNPRPAGVFGRTRPAGGGGADSAPPCLTPERMVVERREKRQTKALNKTNLQNTKKFTLRGQMVDHNLASFFFFHLYPAALSPGYVAPLW